MLSVVWGHFPILLLDAKEWKVGVCLAGRSLVRPLARGHLRECVPRKNALKPVADGILSQDGQQGHRKELPLQGMSELF